MRKISILILMTIVGFNAFAKTWTSTLKAYDQKTHSSVEVYVHAEAPEDNQEWLDEQAKQFVDGFIEGCRETNDVNSVIYADVEVFPGYFVFAIMRNGKRFLYRRITYDGEVLEDFVF